MMGGVGVMREGVTGRVGRVGGSELLDGARSEGGHEGSEGCQQCLGLSFFSSQTAGVLAVGMGKVLGGGVGQAIGEGRTAVRP